MFVIECEVSGGVTGYRRSVVKRDGVAVAFDSREAAQARAEELMAWANRPGRTVDFRYWVQEETT
jgi:hypothetical protein